MITEDGVEAHHIDELPALLNKPNAVIWVDVPACDAEAARVRADIFDFHPLAVRDCVERNRVPKVHAYADLVSDIADRFDRVRAVADGQREYLQGVIEFYQTMLTIKSTLVGQAQSEEVKRLTEASYTQNEEIMKISAWAAIFFAPTLIGTVYGMNFDHMPELHWTAGYPSALLVMLLRATTVMGRDGSNSGAAMTVSSVHCCVVTD